jgi:hypothetical protein
MSDTPKAPLTMLPKIGPAVDMSGLNLAGVNTDKAITDQFGQMMKANEDYEKALEERYTNPNWGKVSAALLKPQLGGFAASMGSAFDVLGEQTEQQRAVAPTIAQIRAQTSAMGLGLQQKKTANELLNERMNKTGGLTYQDVAYIAQYDKEAGRLAQEQFANQNATFDKMYMAYQGGKDYTQLVNDFGAEFVNRMWPVLLKMVPGVPSGGGAPRPAAGATPPAGGAGAPAAGGAPSPQPAAPAAGVVLPEPPNPNAGASTRPLGVPASLMENATNRQGLEATKKQIEERVAATTILQDRYRTQAETSVPIFETATNLYRLASPKYMAPAFAIFERGDPMGVIGQALESQTVSGVLGNMRKQIELSRMSKGEKDKALTNLKTMETQLGDLQTKMQQGIINPTDARTMFEAASVPNMKNTQDSFLRGIAGIGSTSLGRYETKNVFQQFLNRPDADINNWEDSPEYRKLRTHLEKRTRGVLENSATDRFPDFMRNGLENTYRHRDETAANRPNTSAASSSNLTPASASRSTNDAALKAEMKKRNLPTN